MAVFDEGANKIVVRIAYDGPAEAGKTTNIEQVARFFPADKRSDMHRSAESAGQRTLYLDWMQVDCGLVDGYELRCHLLTVPGQAVLIRRRRFLLQRADAVVFVFDCSKNGMLHGRQMWEELLTIFSGLDADQLPIVIQANKRDLNSHISDDEIRDHLGCPKSIPIVRGEARNGVGVREALVLAMRAASTAVKRTLRRDGIASMTGHYEGPEQLRASIDAEERLNPLLPVDVLLSRNQIWATSQTSLSSPANSSAETTVSGSPGSLELTRTAHPELPHSNLPAGQIWPTIAGREIFRRIPRQDAELCAPSAEDPHPATEWIFEAGLWRLRTKAEWCYPTLETARGELLRLARFRIYLGPLMPPQSAICVQPTRTGQFQIWTVAPWLTTLRNLMSYAAGRKDSGALTHALNQYADAVAATLRLDPESACNLDLNPDHFGILGDRCFYLPDEAAGAGPEGPLDALLARVAEYAEHAAAIEAFLDHTVARLLELSNSGHSRRLTYAPRAELGPSPLVAMARRRLEAVLPVLVATPREAAQS